MSLPASLGSFDPLPGDWRPLALAAWALALALAVALQRWQVGLRRAETARWWVSNGRDLLNLLALGILAGALLLLGFPGPAALLLGATILLPLILLATAAVRRERLSALLPALAALLGVPVAVAPDRVHVFVASLATRLAG